MLLRRLLVLCVVLVCYSCCCSSVSKDVPLRAQLMAAIKEKDDDKVGPVRHCCTNMTHRFWGGGGRCLSKSDRPLPSDQQARYVAMWQAVVGR